MPWPSSGLNSFDQPWKGESLWPAWLATGGSPLAPRNIGPAGIAGLARKGRSDRGKRHLSDTLRQAIEGLALKKPTLSAAAIHRQAVTLAERLGEPPPTYRIVYAVIRDLEPALVTLAHEGTKAYSEAYDLIHRHEATAPNAVWQADHTELDIWLKDGRERPEKPWLTIILDDYSRAIAGYALSFSAARYASGEAKS